MTENKRNKTMTQHLVSIGHLVQAFQRSYVDIVKTLADAGIKPVMTQNLTPWYDFNESYRTLDPAHPMIRGAFVDE